MYRPRNSKYRLDRRLVVALLGAALLTAAPGISPAAADDAGAERARVVREAEARTGGGRVLAVEPREREGRRLYRVKVLTPEGRVRVLWIEP